jgi:CRISPR-associated protein Csy1
MIDPAIDDFFQLRKAAWLKKNLKPSMNDGEIKEKEIECESVFSLAQWLPNAAKRAGQISLSTHPCTFSHPSARKNKNGNVTSIIANSPQRNDGFLRSGNVVVASDALGNAAALDVYKFLTLQMQDGMSLIQHLEQDSELAMALFTLKQQDATSYADLKDGLLAMTTSNSDNVTSAKIKQVYFPIDDDYHQLSILTASGLVFELRKRLDDIRFGDDIKVARKKKKDNEHHSNFKEIYQLTTIGYGGTKPQNISVLNNQNGGKAHLLMSAPPELANRDSHFPVADFFSQSVRYFHCKDLFNQLHQLYSQDDNNMHVRARRDEYYQAVIDYVIEKMWAARSVAATQFYAKTNQLNRAQQIWLCDEHQQLRETTDDWLDNIIQPATTFLFHGYEKTLGKKAIMLGDAELKHMADIVSNNKEALR